MSILPSLVAALALMQLAPITEAGRAVSEEEAARLAHCLDLAESDPETAYEEGLAWLSAGSRPHARHCAAVALIELGHEAEGAARLEDLANAPDGGTLEERTLYLSKAGNAWMAAGYPEAALTTLDNALRLAPDSTDLRIDRATARLALGHWNEALTDLDAVLSTLPGDPGALELRARAYLQLERFTEALADVETARSVTPDNIDLLVLRGEIREARRVSGN